MSSKAGKLGEPRHEGAQVLARIAENYYIDGLSQDQIASRFSISRSYVSRLLDRARNLGIVEISIHQPVRTDPALEAELRSRFRLKDCIVITTGENGATEPLRLAGEAAGDYLCEVISPQDTLALSWGTGVKAVIEALRSDRARARHVVQMFGGLSLETNDISGPDLVARIARALGAGFQYLHAPWLVEGGDIAHALMNQPDVAEALRRAAAADIAYVGIGASGKGSSALLFNRTYLSAAELRELKEAGAVGDICGRNFTADGRACKLSFDDRIIGLDLERLKKIPVVVGLAIGEHKAAAILAALRGGLVSVLVTDRSGALGALAE